MVVMLGTIRPVVVTLAIMRRDNSYGMVMVVKVVSGVPNWLVVA